MSLITANYVKKQFPQWEHYAQFASDPDTEITLSEQIQQGEIELADYTTVSESTITPAIRRHLFNMIRKNLFMLKHADTEFDHRPQVLKDYDKTIEMMTELRQGDRPSVSPTPDSAQLGLKVTAKKRRYTEWFRDSGGHQTSSVEE